MRSQTQFQQMRKAILEHPEMFNNVLQYMCQINLGLIQLILENRETYLNMLNESYEDGNVGMHNITQQQT